MDKTYRRYKYAHVVLPHLALKESAALYKRLSPVSRNYQLTQLWNLISKECGASINDYEITCEKLDFFDKELYIIYLPPPTKPPEAYLSAVMFDIQKRFLSKEVVKCRYFTCEKSYDVEQRHETFAFGEWTVDKPGFDLQHILWSMMPSTHTDVFLSHIKRVVKGDFIKCYDTPQLSNSQFLINFDTAYKDRSSVEVQNLTKRENNSIDSSIAKKIYSRWSRIIFPDEFDKMIYEICSSHIQLLEKIEIYSSKCIYKDLGREILRESKQSLLLIAKTAFFIGAEYGAGNPNNVNLTSEKVIDLSHQLTISLDNTINDFLHRLRSCNAINKKVYMEFNSKWRAAFAALQFICTSHGEKYGKVHSKRLLGHFHSMIEEDLIE
jgi:hypothetical protein